MTMLRKDQKFQSRRAPILIYVYRVYKKSRQFRNGSQPRKAASSMKFFVNIDCLGPCDVE